MSLEKPPFSPIEPSNFRLGVVAAQFNQGLVDSLLSRVVEVIEENGKPMELVIERVPGSNEIPAALNFMLENKSFSCLLGLGVVIKGSTSHHHLVAESAGNAIQSLMIKHNTPIINGIIVTDDRQTAEERISGSIDRGREFAQSALQMANLKGKWTTIS
tara:strand:- start:11985 stop:12461 length:477 start_codon:yes stop_codon:yes gene_type:complete